VTLGGEPGGDRLLLGDADLQGRYQEESTKLGVPIDATYLDILHRSCLKNDAASREWVLRGIQATKALGAPILMTVFFGKCSVLNRTELEYVASAFRDLAKEAERAGIVIGFENLLSAEDNMRAYDLVASHAFKIYYDVGNSTNIGGFDVPKEIHWLGRDRICQFHIKDKGYLGEGKVDVAGAVQAIKDIGFSGFANLETSSPSGDVEKDTARQLGYLKGLIG
jgi:sugar phosphate isomerase/epimerase